MEKRYDLKEKTLHGTLSMPLGYYLCHVPQDFTVLPVHWHEEIEITRIREGTVTYYIQSEQYLLNEQNFLVLLPFTLHGIEQREGKTMCSDSFVFNLNMLGGTYPDSCAVTYFYPLLEERGKVPVIVRKEESRYGELNKIFEQILLCYTKKGFGYELRLKACLFEFMGELLTPEMLSKEKKQDIQVLEKVKQGIGYIQENYREAISVKELAEVCQFSEYHFMRLFRKYTNMTCIDYINTYRLSSALEELENTDHSITEIAISNGFNTISYFNRLFRQKYGMTPREYRNNLNLERIIPDS